MKPATHNLADLFGADVRYVVPLYQRPYVWRRETHWQPLWDDVVDVLRRKAEVPDSSPSHFLGAVVLDQEDTAPGEATRRLVIDGQQRLTTLQLLLAAAAAEAQHAGAERAGRLLSKLVKNDADLTSGDARFKVWPTNANQAAFRAVMTEEGGPDDPDNTIHESYAFFRRVVRAWSREGQPGLEDVLARFDDLRVVLTSLLNVVSINLEPGDNAQVIFETLNARGTPLLAMDLVKNALFYRASQAGLQADSLHDQVWEPELGQAYWRTEVRQGRLKRPRAELFLMHWLAMKLRRIVPATELFSEFRAHILNQSSAAVVEGLIHELCRDAAIMRSFDDQPQGSPEARFFATLDALDTTTVLPVALALFRRKDVDVGERRRALVGIESWLVRRMLMGLTSKNYNKTGADLLDAADAPGGQAADSIIDALSSSDVVVQRWPTDKDIARALVTRYLYGYVAQRRIVMVLSELEQARRAANSKVDVLALPAKLTIEHILPQKWREHWPTTSHEEGAERERIEAARDDVLHRIGNLTLTTGPLNSSLSNAPWETKRHALHQHSLLLLNAELVARKAWDVDDINRRGFELALEICRVWPSPDALRGAMSDDDLSLEVILKEAAAAALAASGSSGSSVSLADLLDRGYLEEGETLVPRRGGVTTIAVVLDGGRLECNGQVFSSPSSAAASAAGTQAENGWTFWLACRDGELLSLSDIRSQLASARSN